MTLRSFSISIIKPPQSFLLIVSCQQHPEQWHYPSVVSYFLCCCFALSGIVSLSFSIMFNVIEACLIRTLASKGGVDHYLVRLTLCDLLGYYSFYRIFEKTQKGMQWRNEYANNPAWEVLTRITDGRITGVLARLTIAQNWTNYHLPQSNCEHFARYVIGGVDRSSQVINGAFLAFGGLALAGIVLRDSEHL